MATLSEVVKGIQSTNELLVENVKGQNRTAAMITAFVTGQQASFGDRLEAGREKGKSTKATAQPVRGSSGGGFKSGFMKGSGLGSLLGIGSKIIGAIFAGAAGAALLSTIAGVITGKIILGAAAIGLIRTFGEGAVNKILEMLDPNNLYFNGEQKAAISQSFTTNLQFGLLAFLINKRFGVAVFLGLMLKDLAMSMLGDKGRENMKKTIFDKKFENEFLQKFVDQFTGENLATVGGVIASFFGIGAITRGLMFAFTGGAGVAGAVAGKQATVGRNKKGQFTKLRPGLKAGFLKGFGLKLGLAMMMPMIGEAMGNQISALTGNEELGNMASTFITPVLIGLMLAGPYGALIAALGTLAVIGFGKIRKFITDKNDKIEGDLKKAAAAADKAFEDDPNDVTKRNKKRADYDLNQYLLRKSEISGGGFTAGDTIEREIRSHMKLNRKNPLMSDFYNDFSREFYRGNMGQDRMNPYIKGSPDYIAFKKAAQRRETMRINAEQPPGMNEINAFKRYHMGGATAQPGPFGSLSMFGRNEQNLALAIKMIASNSRANARTLALLETQMRMREAEENAPGSLVVQVAGNQKVTTIDYTTHNDPSRIAYFGRGVMAGIQ